MTLRLSLALVSLAAAGALAPLAVAAPAPAPACQVLTCETEVANLLNANMLDLETKANDHFRFGLMAGSRFGTPEQLSGDVTGTGGYGDSGGLWTGVYLGGEAMRYATAKSYLARDHRAPGKSAGQGKSDDAPGHNKDALTDEERLATETYLYKKWFGVALPK